MSERLTDDEMRAAAARRPGYATYPEYRPGQPERLGRLPLSPAPARAVRVVVDPDRNTISVPVDVPEISTRGVRPDGAVTMAPGPILTLTLDHKQGVDDPTAVMLRERFLAAPPGCVPLDDGITLAALPESPVFEFQPRRIGARPWWSRRWNWAVLTAGARVRYGYTWTERGARRRSARHARRVTP